MRPLAFLMERMSYCDAWGHHGRGIRRLRR
jgi:hypothetical protein